MFLLYSLAAMTQVKMFFNSDVAKLEETVQKWLEGAHDFALEVLGISQCEYNDPKTGRGVLVTILYRAKHTQ